MMLSVLQQSLDRKAYLLNQCDILKNLVKSITEI